MATGQSNVDRAKNDEDARAASAAREQQIIDDAKADQADVPAPNTAFQKYRVLPGAAVFSRPGHHMGYMHRHGETVELDAGDSETERLVTLRIIEPVSEPYKGRVTARVLAHAANQLAQTNEPDFGLADGQGVTLPTTGAASVAGPSSDDDESAVIDSGDRSAGE